MTKVRFLKVDGSLDKEVEAPAGSVLLDVAQAAGQPLEHQARIAFAAEHGLAVLVEHRLAAIVGALGVALGQVESK